MWRRHGRACRFWALICRPAAPTCRVEAKHVGQVRGRHLAKRLGLLHRARIINQQLHMHKGTRGGAGRRAGHGAL